ncbi:hypothetical protein BST61_g5328 [Cercospora zeina]
MWPTEYREHARRLMKYLTALRKGSATDLGKEIARAKAAYATRALFFLVSATAMSATPPGTNGTLLRRKCLARGLSLREEERPQAEAGSKGSRQKRASTS